MTVNSFLFQNTALHRKLETNVEAIRILRKELDKYRTERDQFKLMAETIQLRYCALKSTELRDPALDGFLDSSSATKLLNNMREKNIKLSTELERTKDTLLEKEGDIEVLRQEKLELLARFQIGEEAKEKPNPQCADRQELIAQLESLKNANAQLKFDFHTMLDEKGELYYEMEAYKSKTRTLQQELNELEGRRAMETKSQVEKLTKENNTLRERVSNMEKDLEMSRDIIIKYKVRKMCDIICVHVS